MTWIRRRQERKAARRAARLLVALDDIAGAWKLRPARPGRVSIGAGR